MKIKRVLSGLGCGVVLAASVTALAWGRGGAADVPVDDPAAMPAAPTLCLGFVANIVGTNGPDTLVGGPGPDVIAGLDGADNIRGGGGNDVICGGIGNDNIDGEPGNDRLNGGPGNDALADVGGGVDTVDYTDSPAGTFVRINNVGGLTTDGWGGTDSLDNIENADGSLFVDTLFGDNNPNQLDGKNDADQLVGNGGNDILIGGPGNDTANGGAGVDNCTAEILFFCP